MPTDFFCYSLLLTLLLTATPGRAESPSQTIARASSCYQKITFLSDVPRVKSTRDEVHLSDGDLRALAQLPEDAKKAKAYSERIEDFFERWSQNTFRQEDNLPAPEPAQLNRVVNVARDPNCFPFLLKNGKYVPRILKEALKAGPSATASSPAAEDAPAAHR